MKLLIAFSLALSFAALILSLAPIVRRGGEPGPGLPAAGPDSRGAAAGQEKAAFAELRGRLRDLSDRVAALERAALEAGNRAPGGEAGQGKQARAVEEAAEAARKIHEIEARLAGLEAQGAAVPAPRERPEERAAVVAEAQQTVLDRSLPPEERLQALRDLRFRDGRSREVTLAMVELLADTTLDPRLRGDIIRNMDGVTFEELKGPVLHALRNDPAPEVRSEAAETISKFIADEGVETALTHARDHDQDPEVRVEAARRLAEWQARRRGNAGKE